MVASGKHDFFFNLNATSLPKKTKNRPNPQKEAGSSPLTAILQGQVDGLEGGFWCGSSDDWMVGRRSFQSKRHSLLVQAISFNRMDFCR